MVRPLGWTRARRGTAMILNTALGIDERSPKGARYVIVANIAPLAGNNDRTPDPASAFLPEIEGHERLSVPANNALGWRAVHNILRSKGDGAF